MTHARLAQTPAHPAADHQSPAHPADHKKATLNALVREVATDAHTSPATYLRDTHVPGGGE